MTAVIVAVVEAVVLVVFLVLWLRLRRQREQRLARKVDQLHRRIARIPADSLPDWAEQALGETGRSFSTWRRSGEEIFLDEASIGAEALMAVLTRMRTRAADR